MYVVLKENFKRSGPVVYGGRNTGKRIIEIDRIVNTLDEVESGEVFIECNIKKLK